jgi:ATP-binding cassette subfamily B protein
MAIKISPRKTFWSNLKSVIRIFWNSNKTAFLLSLLLTIILGLLPIALSYLYKLVLDRIIFDTTLKIVTITLLALFSLRYLVSYFTDTINALLYQYVDRIFRYDIEKYTTTQFAEKASQLDMAYLDDSETRSLYRKAVEAYPHRIVSFGTNLFYGASDVVTFIGSFLAILQFGTWIPLVAIAATIPGFYVSAKSTKITWNIFDKNIPEAKELSYLVKLMDNRDSVKELRIFQATKEIIKKIDDTESTIIKKAKQPLKTFIFGYFAASLIETVTLGTLAYLRLPSVVSGLITIGTFSFFISMLDSVIQSSRRFSSYINTVFESSLYAKDYFDFLNLPKLIQEKIPGQIIEEIEPVKIEFQNVSFTYPNGSPVLKNISFTLNPGEHLAIVGPNGAGKSTLIKILLRFYDPDRGAVLINDFDLKDLHLDNWYKFIGTLFQDFIKYQFSIKDNIILGDTTTFDEEKMLKAARMAGADEFIEKLPKKYKQRLGTQFEGGIELSVGQWQKLALARAFYEEAPVLILDEPTSAIDAEAEAEIFDNLNKVYKNKTVIFISHRFSTVRHADKIIVLKNGRIAEEGTHESLMKENGVYARMFRKQAKGYIE